MADVPVVSEDIEDVEATSVSPRGGVFQIMGIHPLMAMTVLAVDVMLFGGTVATGGVGWLLSVPVGVLLGVATALLQKGSYGDNISTSLAKGFVVGLLTAIPTPLPSFITASSGIMGLLSLKKRA